MRVQPEFGIVKSGRTELRPNMIWTLVFGWSCECGVRNFMAMDDASDLRRSCYVLHVNLCPTQEWLVT